MIRSDFMISVLWGEGMHYFSGGNDIHEVAVAHAVSTLTYVTDIWERNGKKGNKPTVYVWQIRDSFTVESRVHHDLVDRIELNSGETPPASPV